MCHLSEWYIDVQMIKWGIVYCILLLRGVESAGRGDGRRAVLGPCRWKWQWKLDLKVFTWTVGSPKVFSCLKANVEIKENDHEWQ